MGLLAACALLVAAQVQVEEHLKEYDVEGATSKELRANLDARRPEDEQGRHDALTKWYVRWKYDFDRGEGCRLKNIRVRLEVNRTMPRWVNEAEPLAQRWRSYLDALKTHEDGHAKNGRDCAETILARLRKVAPQPDCERLEKLANAEGDGELGRARQRDLDYDAQTKHGETQGATFR